MRQYSRLLLDEAPLFVLPSLAKIFGTNESLIIQQVHYWTGSVKNKKVHEGRKWIYRTYAHWLEEMPFLSDSTLRRAIKKLEKLGVLITGNFNKHVRDRTRWYALDHERITQLELEAESAKIPNKCQESDGLEIDKNFQIGTLEDAKTSDDELVIGTCGQNDQIHVVKMTRSMWSKRPDVLIPETTTETTTKSIAHSREDSFPKEFETFWHLYEKKKEKGRAFKKFNELLSKDYNLYGIIIDAVKAQKVDRLAKQSKNLWQPEMKHPTTWLNAECWHDEVITSREQLDDEVRRYNSGKDSSHHRASRRNDALAELTRATRANAERIEREAAEARIETSSS